MSAESRVSFLSLVVGTLFSAALGGLIGGAWGMGATGWGDFFPRVMIGAFCGLLPGVVIGFCLAWHAAAIAGSPAAAATAPLWGVVPGLLLGASLGPPLGATAGALFGQLAGGGMIGLLCGGLCGVIAWETAYFGDLLVEQVRARAARSQRPVDTRQTTGH
jgi:hypothetical protein